MPASSNPQFRNQWHFNEIGDIETVWQDYTGAGVRVIVADDGTQSDHPDLDDNYNGSLTFSGAFGSDNGQPRSAGSGHGTSVAGLIAAEDNGIGGIGVAHGASLTGLNLIENGGSEARGAAMIRFAGNFDIINNSWGYGPDFTSSPAPTSSPEDGGSLEGRAFNFLADVGRGGLGTISVKAAGNESSSAQGEWLNNQHQTIVVAATERGGGAASFSNYGTNILISAPAATHTTDRTGTAGYEGGDFTTDFGGTSASTPIVSGVVALMLEANPDLGWRDVQNILAVSAQHTGSDLGDARQGSERGTWFSNDATNWNGGGLTFNVSYGFGQIDAHAAVRMAEAWHLFEPAQRSSNEREVKASYNGPAQTISDNSTTSFQIQVTSNIDIEHIYVEVEGRHTYLGDLEITLISPTGERYELSDNQGGATDLDGWTFGVAAARGDTTRGTWTVEVRDNAAGDTGNISDVNLTFTGGAISRNTVHHFTDDFLGYAAEESDRRTISDTDNGYDWLNLVAVTGDVTLNLAKGGALSVDGRSWARIDGQSVIEAAALGDGDDYVIGNTINNWIHGGRGADRVFGREGNDLIYGEWGNDRLYGQSGNDRLFGGDGNDSLYGAEGADLLYGGANNDLLNGGDGNDLLYGQGGANRLYGLDGRDRINGGTGNDRAYGGNDRDTVLGFNGDDTLWGGNDNDTVYGNYGDDVAWGDAGNDSLHGGFGDDTVSGGPGNDRVLGSFDDDIAVGGNGNDTVTGNEGNDTVYGGNGNDFVTGGDGEDSVLGQAGNDWVTGLNGNDTIYGHDGNDTMNGNDGDDSVIGGGGIDLMYGGEGADVLFGQGGADEVFGGNGNDTIYGGDGNDVVSGQDGNDLIFGNAGVDTINGGQGDDTLAGGNDSDAFVFDDSDFGDDRITDFAVAEDVLQIDGDLVPGGASVNAVLASAQIVGGNVVLDFGSAGSITLEGIGSTAGLASAIEIL